MDYFQGVVTEYLRADRAVFVNTECCIQLNPGANPDKTGPHWYCDAVAVNFRTREVFLCEVTYSKSLSALLSRLSHWSEHWPRLKAALVRDCSLPAEWPICPWLFVPKELRADLEQKLRKLNAVEVAGERMPYPEITELEEVLPWKYRSWNRHTDCPEDAA